ncbi:E3 ubiquitin-protein ligase PRT1 (Proteolysis 1 protein) (RING-type E3 ubiquitin transferase PRT1) [Durusdinium trenchii]|uniref:E3 ubiquitin-protein ligase PRT1 (Proteolysis 1 protein) (RING-type E3 ubiquitin transferase PRT1) n=1 Tax=Durusdinium trenchii TaxID=1381693 RepID=A0ABP0L5W9_9DINO
MATDIKVPKGDVPDEFCCAASGRPLFYPVVTDQGIAYCYSVLFEMFLKAEVPKCVVTGEPITFFPNVCTALHHFMLDVYKKDLKGRKAIEESILAVFNLKVPSIADAPDEDGDDGLMEEFTCPVSKTLAFEPCCLSSGTVVSARAIPPGGFKKDPNRLVACALHGQAPKTSEVLALMIRTKFPSQYKALEAKNAGVELVPQPTCSDFPADAYVHLGLGCDGCGLWPIRGVAYEDVDCRSATGFHLCEACYELGYHKRVLGGRFNQGHMPKNTMCRVIPAGY